MNNKLAVLESKIDQLEAEIYYLNKLLIQIGFDEGIQTLKVAAAELLEEQLISSDPSGD